MFTAAQPQQDFVVKLASLDTILMMCNYSLRCRFSAKLCRSFTFVFHQVTAMCFLRKLVLSFCSGDYAKSRLNSRTLRVRNFDALGSRLCMKDMQILKKKDLTGKGWKSLQSFNILPRMTTSVNKVLRARSFCLKMHEIV